MVIGPLTDALNAMVMEPTAIGLVSLNSNNGYTPVSICALCEADLWEGVDFTGIKFICCATLNRVGLQLLPFSREPAQLSFPGDENLTCKEDRKAVLELVAGMVWLILYFLHC